MAQVDSENSTAAPGGSPTADVYTPTPVTPEEAFQAIGRLRKEARDEIDRLIKFLDHTDDYVSRELEDDGDQADASYPESGQKVCSPMEDDEECGDENEPSLGSLASGERSSQASWAAGNNGDLEDEHDGAEPEDEGGEAVHEDDEPTLGWTIEGQGGSVRAEADDCEVQDHLRVRPQDRTDLGAGISAETSYRRFLHGLSTDQREAVRARMTSADVSLVGGPAWGEK